MTEDFGKADFGSAWSFAAKHWLQLLREQWIGLTILVVLDVILAIMGTPNRPFSGIAWYPLAASLVRLAQPDFALRRNILIGLIGLQLLISVVVLAAPAVGYAIGISTGSVRFWLAVGCIVAVPLFGKLTLAPYLYLLGRRDATSIGDAIALSWRAMRISELLTWLALNLAIVASFILAAIVPFAVVGFIIIPFPQLRPAAIIVVDVFSIGVTAFLTAAVVQFTAQRVPRFAGRLAPPALPTPIP